MLTPGSVRFNYPINCYIYFDTQTVTPDISNHVHSGNLKNRATFLHLVSIDRLKLIKHEKHV